MRLEDYRSFEIGNPRFRRYQLHERVTNQICLRVRGLCEKAKSDCPIVWGGVHPTLLPEQTASNGYVDVVVRGEGELIVKDLANALASHKPLDNVLGITYRSGRVIKSNPDGKVIDLDAIPVDLPYDLLKMKRYPSVKSGRFHIQTSRGCPHRCGFCYNSLFNKNKWRAKSAERVLDEIEYILEKFPQVKIIDPIDDNFFVDEDRVKQICNGHFRSET